MCVGNGLGSTSSPIEKCELCEGCSCGGGGGAVLVSGHSHDGELPLWALSSLFSPTLWGEKETRGGGEDKGGEGREGTPEEHKHNPLISVKG